MKKPAAAEKPATKGVGDDAGLKKKRLAAKKKAGGKEADGVSSELAGELLNLGLQANGAKTKKTGANAKATAKPNALAAGKAKAMAKRPAADAEAAKAPTEDGEKRDDKKAKKFFKLLHGDSLEESIKACYDEALSKRGKGMREAVAKVINAAFESAG